MSYDHKSCWSLCGIIVNLIRLRCYGIGLHGNRNYFYILKSCICWTNITPYSGEPDKAWYKSLLRYFLIYTGTYK